MRGMIPGPLVANRNAACYLPGSRQSPGVEHQARTDPFGAGMPPERPSSSHQLRSEHANGHSQRSPMPAYRDSSLWPQQHSARTDWDAMWQRGGSVPLDAFGLFLLNPYPYLTDLCCEQLPAKSRNMKENDMTKCWLPRAGFTRLSSEKLKLGHVIP